MKKIKKKGAQNEGVIHYFCLFENDIFNYDISRSLIIQFDVVALNVELIIVLF